MLMGFLWVAVSFYWFSQKQTKEALFESAKDNLEFAKLELAQKSKDLRFKLGQWGFNYHLVKTKGLDFDHDSFASSEFESIYFFKKVDGEFKPQWSKSKDLASAAISRSLKSKLKTWTKENIISQEFLYFTDNPSAQGSKLYFGFIIQDDIMGEGVLLSSLDLNYFQLLSPSLNTYLIDPQGRFLFHPQKEYTGLSASNWLKSQNTENTVTQAIPAGIINGELIYKKKTPPWFDQVIMSTFVMLLGLLLIFGVLIFDIYITSPVSMLKGYKDLKSEMTAALAPSEVDKDNLTATSKLDMVRESLNQMSLMSAQLKGRLDLATREKADKTLIHDINSDFSRLDQMLDETYKSLTLNDLKSINKITNQNLNYVPKTPLTEIADETKKTSPLVANIDLFESLDEDHLDFDLKEFELENSIDSDFKNEKFDNEDFDIESFDYELSQKDESKESDHINKSKDQQSFKKTSGVVFQEYIGIDETSNDWAKIIEELTEEINNAPLKPTKSVINSEV